MCSRIRTFALRTTSGDDPTPPYVVFKYENDMWQRIALEALPIEFKTLNVVRSVEKAQADQLIGMGLVSADAINRTQGSLETVEFSSIIREPLPKENIIEKCGDRILYKGNLILPNDPVARKIIDSKKQ